MSGWRRTRDVPRKQRPYGPGGSGSGWSPSTARSRGRGVTVVAGNAARRRAELGPGQDRGPWLPQAQRRQVAEAEVDFGEFHAQVAGVLIKLWMFVLRLFVLGAGPFHAAFATQAQEAFLEGHVLAFEYFGAVPGPGSPGICWRATYSGFLCPGRVMWPVTVR